MIAADWVQVTTLVDNYINPLLRQNSDVRRPLAESLGLENPGYPLMAEFGWSTLVRIGKDGHIYTLLYDTGVSKQALLHNATSLKIDLKEVEAIVLSHGHPDHTASIQEAVTAVGRDGLPLIMHPWATLERMGASPGGEKRLFPRFLREETLHGLGTRIEKNKHPTPLASGAALITGEIPRVTPFEKGLPPNTQFVKYQGDIVHEPLILDDQALIIDLKDKGLVILTGCGHAGIINTIDYSKQISGIDQIYAIMGGFHLEGEYYDSIVSPTVESLKNFSPKLVIPSHCTGLRASFSIMNAMPSNYIENSVGTTFKF